MSAGGHRRLNRALVGAVVVMVAVWFAHLPGGAVCLAYLGPAMFAFLLLWLGHYPGERQLLALSRPTRARRSTPASVPPRRFVVDMPRGGTLLGCALAGRAPPSSLRSC
ncbi:MAG: hypothetical protein ACRDK2_14640 [Solirubrobacteraceae bacterium]